MENFKDSLERIFWTFVSVVGAAAIDALAELELAVVPFIAVVINAVLVWVRRRVPGIPDPGQGLPGARLPARPPGT
jgi:hypothetical protein